MLSLGGDLLGQSGYEADDVPQVQRRGLDQIDRFTESLRRARKICIRVGIVLLLLAVLKVLNPLQLYYGAQDRSLQNAVRDVEDLLKRIREDAEAADDDVTEEEPDAGILAGMPEIAALTESERVLAYVLTVNDRVLDNVGQTLKRLRRFRDGGAERYKGYMFSVVQSHPHLREDAQRMLQIFLKQERAELRKICKTKMIPCRTWEQILYLLGAQDGSQLQQRVEEGRLTMEEIVVLEKAFLQTFAKPDSLNSIYGRGEGARVMLQLHTPQIRSEALALLRRCYQTEHASFERSTELLDAEETPQRHEVAKLIKSFVAQKT